MGNIPGRADPRSPLASPLFASLTWLPPLLVQVGEGLPHIYQTMLGTPEAAEAIEQIGKFVRRHVR